MTTLLQEMNSCYFRALLISWNTVFHYVQQIKTYLVIGNVLLT